MKVRDHEQIAVYKKGNGKAPHSYSSPNDMIPNGSAFRKENLFVPNKYTASMCSNVCREVELIYSRKLLTLQWKKINIITFEAGWQSLNSFILL